MVGGKCQWRGTDDDEDAPEMETQTAVEIKRRKGMKRTVMTNLTASLMRDHWRTKHEVCMPVLSVSRSWTDARGR